MYTYAYAHIIYYYVCTYIMNIDSKMI